MVSENYIATRIKKLRKDAGLDVDAVGKGVGRSGKAVAAWETGRNVPSADMLISICKFFNVDIDYFYPPEVTSKIMIDDATLPDDERKLLSLYRRMSPEGKERLHEQALFLAGRHSKNESVSMQSA